MMSDHQIETKSERLRREFRERALSKKALVDPVVTFENDEGQRIEKPIQERVEAVTPPPPLEVVETGSNQNLLDAVLEVIALGERPGIEEAKPIPTPPTEDKRKGVTLRSRLYLGDIHDELKKSNEARRVAKGYRLPNPLK